jgi:peptidoglycan/LPS O-acetylase OafA/YrhL
MKEIRSLTAMRGLAAMAVVLQHFSATVERHADGPIPSLAPRGYLAVDFFFVLSGFIIAYTYRPSFQKLGAQAMGPFLVRRGIRLLPLNMALTVLLALGASLTGSALGRNMFYAPLPHGPWDVLANLFLLPGIGIGQLMNGTAWSISTELVAYALFPLLLASVFAARAAVSVLTGMCAIGGLALLAASQPHWNLGVGSPALGTWRCVTEFTLGVFAYRLWGESRRAVALGRDRWTACLLVLALLGVALRFDLLVVMTFPAIVISVAHNKGWFDRLLNTPLPYFLGVISYSLYLVHDGMRPLAMTLIRHLHPQPLSKAWAIACVLLASAAVIAVAWLTYHVFERMPREWLQRRLFPTLPASRAPVG